MALLSGGEMIVQALKDENVEYIFGYPGGAVLHIYDALFNKSDIPHILVRHEQAATHAADGYARATGKVGVVLVTSGPGATNAVTGIATAYMDSIPMVVLSGQVQSHLIGEDAFQETDMIGVSRPIVKHSFLVKDTPSIPDVIKKAFYLARTGRPGPVVVDLPKDITHPDKRYPYHYPEHVSMRSYSPAVKGHGGQIKKAVQLIMQAKRPVVYAGGGVIHADASEALIAWVKQMNAPITHTLMGLGAFPASDDHFLGMLGMHGTYEANKAMHHADLIIALGARFDDRVTNDPAKFCPDAKIIHVDVDPASIAKTVRVDVPIVGDIQRVLLDLSTAWAKAGGQAVSTFDTQAQIQWWQQINQWREQQGLWHTPRYQTDTSVIKPQAVIDAWWRLTNGDAFVCSDVGQHQMFAAQYYRFNKPRRWINSGGLGTMGFGLPSAMGVSLAFPDEIVSVVTGEGSIQMNIQELSTCLQYNLPIKILNLNNGYLGMVKQWQDMQYGGRYSQSEYENSLPDFVKLTEAYGHVGIRVTKPEALESALQQAIDLKDRLVFLDIHVDRHEHVYPMQVAMGAMDDMVLQKEGDA